MSVGAIVIVGAGQAGGWAARTLRDAGYEGRVVLLGAEPHAPYERPPLSKAVLAGQAAPETTELFGAAALRELGVDFRPGAVARELRLREKTVVCADGPGVAYDKLLLCCGGRALVPALPGANLPGVHVLRTRDDALRLRQALGQGTRLAVVGGGWIGLEVAATARRMGCQVTVIEQAGRLCARSVMPGVSDALAELHRGHGVALRLGTGVAGILPAGPDLALALSDDTVMAADAVVLGVGLQPNDELARAAGLACEGGVLVDEYCRTSAPDVYAAGDVAVMQVAAAGRRLRLESWQNAQDQGAAAARACSGLGWRGCSERGRFCPADEASLESRAVTSPEGAAVS
ncbi:NAD(P)/FAD-dependent oxidoreductase [Bordetella petrii]|uniref:NAD(P)/FAD-dependent oxidoreductase n=1 Tax=Bordetella petrii TaxID=94624 RepID=UPI001E3D42C1|nr:FAD-dependent oxidoreductase [Bordetella petrii]MCD0505820.1 FAD-dependent oxidoreductase [Bordetella petrii]